MYSLMKLRTTAPRLRTLSAALALSLSAGLSHAAQATVSVTSFSYITSGAALTWSDPYQSFDTTALNGGGLLGSRTDSFATDDWGFLAVGANTANAIAVAATTTPQTFFIDSTATRSLGPVGTPRNQATSLASQSGTFMLSDAGSVTFTVGYTLMATAPGGSASTDFAGASLAFSAFNGRNTSGANPSDSLTSFAQASGMATRNGSFNVTVNLAAGEAGFYSLDGSATAFAAVVPEPAEWALMTGGLLALSAVVRRRKQRAIA